MPAPTSRVSRKRTRSRHLSESNPTENGDERATTSSATSSSSSDAISHPAPPKRQRHQSSTPRNNYSLRTRLSAPISSRDSSTNSSHYNLRPRPAPSQSHYRETATTSTESNRLSHHSLSTVAPPRQYRLLYISDEDDPSTNTNASSNNMEETTIPRRTSRSTSSAGLHTRSRTATDPSGTATLVSDTAEFTTGGVAHVRLNRAIEIVIDSIQSLEGAVNNFDQLVFGLIYGRLSSRTEFESIEGMIRLSRILNLNFPSRLTQAEIDALPTIEFHSKADSISSVLLMEKCPICLTEFHDQEVINKLHCTHLFHQPCISTWLSENDSCPTCRRKVNAD